MRANHFYPFWLFLTILVNTSCSDEYIKGTYIASNSEYSLNMSTSDLQSISAAGGVVKMRIEATSAVSWEIQGLPSWLTTTTLNGEGSQDVSFNVDANESFTSSRTHIFNIVTTNSDWKLTIPVSVTQQKKAKEMTIRPSDDASLTFDSNGGKKAISITSNVAWNAECKEDFVHLSQSSAVQDLNMIVSVDAFDQIDATQKRTALIYFKDAVENDVLKVITITQTPLQTSISTENISVEFDQNRNSKVFSLGNIQGDYSVSSDAPWLRIEKNKEKGNIDVTVSVEANENDDERASKAYVFLENSNAILYSFSVWQKGNYLEIQPTSLSCVADGGVYSIDVTTNDMWAASTQQDWISLQENGNSCRMVIAANNSLQTRSGSVQFNRLNDKNEIVGKTVTLSISQEARHITPGVQTIQFGPEAGQKTLSINSDATWTLSSNEPWISLSSGAGNGNAEVTVFVSENASSSSRTGSLYLKCLDKIIEIIIVQNSAYLNTNSNPISFEAKGGEVSLSFNSNSFWKLSANKNWISFSQTEGSNDACIQVIADNNPTMEERDAEIKVSGLFADVKIHVYQKQHSLEISRDKLSLSHVDDYGDITINSSTGDFNATTSEPWITITKTNCNIRVSVNRNPKTTMREGTIRVSEGELMRTIAIEQAASPEPTVKFSAISDLGNTYTTWTWGFSANVNTNGLIITECGFIMKRNSTKDPPVLTLSSCDIRQISTLKSNTFGTEMSGKVIKGYYFFKAYIKTSEGEIFYSPVWMSDKFSK